MKLYLFNWNENPEKNETKFLLSLRIITGWWIQFYLIELTLKVHCVTWNWKIINAAGEQMRVQSTRLTRAGIRCICNAYYLRIPVWLSSESRYFINFSTTSLQGVTKNKLVCTFFESIQRFFVQDLSCKNLHSFSNHPFHAILSPIMSNCLHLKKKELLSWIQMANQVWIVFLKAGKWKIQFFIQIK